MTVRYRFKGTWMGQQNTSTYHLLPSIIAVYALYPNVNRKYAWVANDIEFKRSLHGESRSKNWARRSAADAAHKLRAIR